MKVKVDGLEIGCELRGSGAPLLLLMGLGAPGAAWEPHVREWEKHFRCIVMDNRGAGASGKPAGPYTTARMADDAAGLLDQLDLPAVHVAGISMGSAIAQELALRRPDRVRRLVLISSWARCDDYMKQLFETFALTRSRLSPQAFTRLLQLWIWTPGYFSAQRDAMVEAAEQAGVDPMPEAAFAAQCQACLTHDTLDRLARITQPSLLTVGDADIFTPPRLSIAMQEQLPQARLEVFAGGGHCHHWEELDRFNRTVCDFLLPQP